MTHEGVKTMPDKPIPVVYWRCNSLTGFHCEVPSNSEPGKKYIVRHERLTSAEALKRMAHYGFTCECKGYEVRSHCSHIKRVMAEKPPIYCGWDQQYDPTQREPLIEPPDLGPDGEPISGGKRLCPKCGAYCHVYTEGVM